jgi:hypothetical protein
MWEEDGGFGPEGECPRRGIHRKVANRSARLQLISHSCEEVMILERLRQKSYLRRNQSHIHELRRKAAHENDRQSGVETGQCCGELPAIHDRHPEVGKHKTHLLVSPMGQELKSTRAIRGLEDGIALILKQAAYDASQAFLVLYHQYSVSLVADLTAAAHGDSSLS